MGKRSPRALQTIQDKIAVERARIVFVAHARYSQNNDDNKKVYWEESLFRRGKTQNRCLAISSKSHCVQKFNLTAYSGWNSRIRIGHVLATCYNRSSPRRHDPPLFVDSLWVAPEFRQVGLGRCLMNRFLQDVGKHYSIHLTVVPFGRSAGDFQPHANRMDRKQLRKFYRSFGFRLLSQRKMYRPKS